MCLKGSTYTPPPGRVGLILLILSKNNTFQACEIVVMPKVPNMSPEDNWCIIKWLAYYIFVVY